MTLPDFDSEAGKLYLSFAQYYLRYQQEDLHKKTLKDLNPLIRKLLIPWQAGGINNVMYLAERNFAARYEGRMRKGFYPSGAYLMSKSIPFLSYTCTFLVIELYTVFSILGKTIGNIFITSYSSNNLLTLS